MKVLRRKKKKKTIKKVKNIFFLNEFSPDGGGTIPGGGTKLGGIISNLNISFNFNNKFIICDILFFWFLLGGIPGIPGGGIPGIPGGGIPGIPGGGIPGGGIPGIPGGGTKLGGIISALKKIFF